MVFSLRHSLFLGLANLAAASLTWLANGRNREHESPSRIGEVPEKRKVPLKELEEKRA